MSTEKTGVIEETMDYSIFKLLPHNRPIVQTHVRRLVASMSERPHLRIARPILVNEAYQVIDGQHRLKAAELNGQSIYYMLVPGLTIDDARLLNALQRTWGLLDYGYSYASSKLPGYVQFIETYEARNLPPSIVLEYMAVTDTKRRYDFRIGLLQVIDQAVLDERLDQVEDIIKVFNPGATPYIVASAFSIVHTTKGYDHERMLKRIGQEKLLPQATRIDYIRELERVYNTGSPHNGPSYLRFF